MKKTLNLIICTMMCSIFSFAELPDKTDVGEIPSTVYIELVPNTKIYKVSGNGKIDGDKWSEEVRRKGVFDKEDNTLKFESGVRLPDNSTSFFSGKATYDLPSDFDTSNVRIMSRMFSYYKKELPDISNWDTSNVVDMSEMFERTKLANPDVSKWDTSKVVNMVSMFEGAEQANPNVSNWNTSNVVNMEYMFRDMKTATLRIKPDGTVVTKEEIEANEFTGKGMTRDWDVSNVRYMESMFCNATYVNPDTAKWNTENVRNMRYMFYGAKNANPNVSKWKTSKVTDMRSMFVYASRATLRVKSNGIEDSDIVTREEIIANPNGIGIAMTIKNGDIWNVENVTSMYGMFWGATYADPEIGTWDNAISLETTSHMFYNAQNARLDNSRGFYAPNLEDVSSMFQIARKANPDTSLWDMGSVNKMSYMFSRASEANPDVSRWNTSNVTDMNDMFSYAVSATLRIKSDGTVVTKEEIEANPSEGEAMTKTNGNIWNVSKVRTMTSMFSDATHANPEINWDAPSLESTVCMFYRTDYATLENSKGFNAPNLKAAWSMFAHAKRANPDTSLWKMSNVTLANYMFNDAPEANPDVSKWDTSSLTEIKEMFNGAIKANPDTRNWDISKVKKFGNVFNDIKGNDIDITVFRNQTNVPANIMNTFKLKIREKDFKLVVPGHFFGIGGVDLHKFSDNGIIITKEPNNTTNKFRIIKIEKLDPSKNTDNDCSNTAVNKCTVIKELADFGPGSRAALTSEIINKSFIDIDEQTGLPNPFNTTLNYIIEPHLSAKPANYTKPIEVFQFSLITEKDADGKRTNILKDKFLEKAIVNWNQIKAKYPGVKVELVAQSLVYPTDTLGDNKKLKLKVVYPEIPNVEDRVEEIIGASVKVIPIFDPTNSNQYVDIEFNATEDGDFYENGAVSNNKYTIKTFVGLSDDDDEGTYFSRILEKLTQENIVLKEKNEDTKFMFWTDKNGNIVDENTFFNYTYSESIKENDKITLTANYFKVSVNPVDDIIEGANINKKVLELNTDKIVNKIIGIENNGVQIVETPDKSINYDGLDKDEIVLDQNNNLVGKILVTNWENDEVLEKTVTIKLRIYPVVNSVEYKDKYIDKDVTFKVKRNLDFNNDVTTPDIEEVITGNATLTTQIMQGSNIDSFPKEFVLDINNINKVIMANKVVLKTGTKDSNTYNNEILTLLKDREGNWSIVDGDLSPFYINVEANGNIIITPRDKDTILNQLNEKDIVATITNRFNASDTGVTTDKVYYDFSVKQAKISHSYEENDKAKDIDRKIKISNPEDDVIKVEIKIGDELLIFNKNGDTYTKDDATSTVTGTYTLVKDATDDDNIILNLPSEETQEEDFKALDTKKIKVIYYDNANKSLDSNELTLKTISYEEKDENSYTKTVSYSYVDVKVKLLDELRNKLLKNPYVKSLVVKDKTDTDREINERGIAIYKTKGLKSETAIITYLDDSIREVELEAKIFEKKYIESKLDIVKGEDQGTEYTVNGEVKKGVIEGTDISEIVYDDINTTLEDMGITIEENKKNYRVESEFVEYVLGNSKTIVKGFEGIKIDYDNKAINGKVLKRTWNGLDEEQTIKITITNYVSYNGESPITTVEKEILINVLRDTDGDGIPDITDPDDDNDGILDEDDKDPKDRLSYYYNNYYEPTPETVVVFFNQPKELNKNTSNLNINGVEYIHYPYLDKLFKISGLKHKNDIPYNSEEQDFRFLIKADDEKAKKLLDAKTISMTGEKITLYVLYKDKTMDIGEYLTIKVLDQLPPEIIARDIYLTENVEYNEEILAKAFDKSGIKKFEIVDLANTLLPQGLQNINDSLEEVSKIDDDGETITGKQLSITGKPVIDDWENQSKKVFPITIIAEDEVGTIAKTNINIIVKKNPIKVKDVYVMVGEKLPEAKTVVENIEELINNGTIKNEDAFAWDTLTVDLNKDNTEKDGDYQDLIVKLKSNEKLTVKVKVYVYDNKMLKGILDQMKYYDTSIVERFDEKYFAKVNLGPVMSIVKDVVTEGKFEPEKLISGVSAGFSTKPFKDHQEVKIIGFMEYANKLTNHVMLGVGIKVEDYLKAFARYRLSILAKNKHYNKNIVVTNNLDVFANYNQKVNLKEDFYITPSIGTYISVGGGKLTSAMRGYSLEAKLESGLKLEYLNKDNLSVYVTPELKIAYNQYIYELIKTKHKIYEKPDGYLNYNLVLGIDKKLPNRVTIGGSARYLGTLKSFRDVKNLENALNFEIHSGYSW